MVTTSTHERRRDAREAPAFGASSRESIDEILGDVGEDVRYLREELSAFAAIKIEHLRLSLVRAFLRAAGWALAGLVALIVLGTSIVLCFIGAASAIAEATGHSWIGSVTAGASGLALAAVGFFVVRGAIRRAFAPSKHD